MEFKIEEAIEVLERTPGVIEEMLKGLPADWVMHNEGPDTWSPYDIVGHLIHGEKTDWIPRMNIILSDSTDKKFTPFDMTAHFANSKGKSLPQLIDELKDLRRLGINTL